MKKAIVFLVAIVAVISMSSSVSMARNTYPADVNTICGTGTVNSCDFCHNNTANYDAYVADGACGICPTDPDCVSTPPPPPNCTDDDRDGFFLEPGCGQLYDCDDTNINIYPGAREIACDDIDQDCSGADKTKGKGCRPRK